MNIAFIQETIEDLNRFSKEQEQYSLRLSESVVQILYGEKVIFQETEEPRMTRLGEVQIVKTLIHHGIVKCKEMIFKRDNLT